MEDCGARVRLRLVASKDALFDTAFLSTVVGELPRKCDSSYEIIARFDGHSYRVWSCDWEDVHFSDVEHAIDAFTSDDFNFDGAKVFAELITEEVPAYRYFARWCNGQIQNTAMMPLPPNGVTGRLIDIKMCSGCTLDIFMNDGNPKVIMRRVKFRDPMRVPPSLWSDAQDICDQYCGERITIAGPFFKFRHIDNVIEAIEGGDMSIWMGASFMAWENTVTN